MIHVRTMIDMSRYSQILSMTRLIQRVVVWARRIIEVYVTFFATVLHIAINFSAVLCQIRICKSTTYCTDKQVKNSERRKDRSSVVRDKLSNKSQSKKNCHADTCDIHQEPNPFGIVFVNTARFFYIKSDPRKNTNSGNVSRHCEKSIVMEEHDEDIDSNKNSNKWTQIILGRRVNVDHFVNPSSFWGVYASLREVLMCHVKSSLFRSIQPLLKR